MVPERGHDKHKIDLGVSWTIVRYRCVRLSRPSPLGAGLILPIWTSHILTFAVLKQESILSLFRERTSGSGVTANKVAPSDPTSPRAT